MISIGKQQRTYNMFIALLCCLLRNNQLTLCYLFLSLSMHESCPHCGKAILQEEQFDPETMTMARRACRSCRKRVGFCFLCHEPVQSLYVWCPGCGHGGHLECALQWFGGLDGVGGEPVRRVCPTGCGHECNALKTLSAFPRTQSLHHLDST